MYTIWIEHYPGIFSKVEANCINTGRVLWDALNSAANGAYKLSARP